MCPAHRAAAIKNSRVVAAVLNLGEPSGAAVAGRRIRFKHDLAAWDGLALISHRAGQVVSSLARRAAGKDTDRSDQKSEGNWQMASHSTIIRWQRSRRRRDWPARDTSAYRYSVA